MKRIALFVAISLLASAPATAGPNWQSINLSISLADAPKVVAALDKLMTSTSEGSTGSVSLMSYVAYGNGSVSHNIISSFESRAEREAWTQKLTTSDAWAKYAKATEGKTQLAGISRMNFLKSWGEEDAADVHWEIFGFEVSDATVFSDALDRLMKSDAGKAFPGSVYLSEIAAAGETSMTHLISVGYKSEAEAESGTAALVASKDWEAYLEVSRKAAAASGVYMMRTIKTWGDGAQ